MNRAQPSNHSEVFWRTTWRDRTLSSLTQAGFVNNLNDGMAWGLFPVFFAAAHMSLDRIGLLAAIYPATSAVLQLATARCPIAPDANGSSPAACGTGAIVAGVVVGVRMRETRHLSGI